MAEYVSCSFTEEHISGLVGVVKDLDQLSFTSMSNYVDMDKLCGAVDQAVHLLLVSDLLSNKQQVKAMAITVYITVFLLNYTGSIQCTMEVQLSTCYLQGAF